MKTRSRHGRARRAGRSGALAILLAVAMGSGVAVASLVRAEPYSAAAATRNAGR